MPINQIEILLKKAVNKFIDKLLLTNYNKKCFVIIKLSKKKYFIINTQNKKYYFSKLCPKKKILMMTLDLNLLYDILKGPKYAHWNNAEIGSHIKYFRNPNVYDKKLFYCLNFFHS